MTKRLQHKVAIVVGAGSVGREISNGAACAVTFSREGAQVICADRSLDASVDSVRRIHDIGGTAEAFEADVRSAAQIRDLGTTA